MPASEKPTIVCVHGLWADGSSWSEIIPRLKADGFKDIAVQNPLTSLQYDVSAVKRALDRAGGPVILVGHSWGGVVITAAGINERVKGLLCRSTCAGRGRDGRSIEREIRSCADLQAYCGCGRLYLAEQRRHPALCWGPI